MNFKSNLWPVFVLLLVGLIFWISSYLRVGLFNIEFYANGPKSILRDFGAGMSMIAVFGSVLCSFIGIIGLIANYFKKIKSARWKWFCIYSFVALFLALGICSNQFMSLDLNRLGTNVK